MPSSPYLPLEFLKSRLLAGLYTIENMPSDDHLAFVIELAEIRLEEWLGRRLAVTHYLDRYKTDMHGNCLIRNFPVLEVQKIAMVPIEQFGYAASHLSLGPFLGRWWQGRKISTGRPGVVVEVAYTAGLDPLPRIIYATFFQLVYSILSNTGISGNLGFLDLPTSDVASMSLPGGLSESYKIGGASGGSGSGIGSNELDRVLAPLAKYRNAYVT